MESKLNLKFILMVIAILCAGILIGCASSTPSPTPTTTSTVTLIPTKTLSPTATITLTPEPSPTATDTLTPEPSPTATLLPVPTSSVNDPSATSLAAECRAVVDGLYSLKKDLGLPDHFMSENPFRQEGDFNPNLYFQVLTHLSITPGYKLDYIYFNDELGGLPLMYARKSGSTPYQSYAELLQSFGEEISGERSYGELGHKYDYLEKIRIDQSPESYFEFVTLAFLGDQFYLWWHGLYNDSKILCDPSDLATVDMELQGFELEFPQDVQDRIEQIDFSPVIVVAEETVTVRYVTFTKWGGFFENVYVMDRENPMQLIDVKFNPLIEYDCGINF